MEDTITALTHGKNERDSECDKGICSPPAVAFRSQVSYGSYLPYFAIDSEYLKSFLRVQGGSYELAESASLKSSHGFPKAFTRTDTTDSDFGTSVIAPPIASINGTVKQTFLTECDSQVRRLFYFMETHLTSAENELASVLKKAKSGKNDETRAERNGRNSNSNSESSENSPLLDSGVVEDDQGEGGRQNIHLLCRIKEILLSLQESLTSSFISLDQLIAIHDDEGLTNDGTLFRQSKESERQNFENRLKTNLDRINSKLGSVEKIKELKIDSQGRLHSESIATANVRKTPVGCFVYLSFFLYVFLWAILLFMYFWRSQHTWIVFFRLTRGPLLVVFFLYYFGVNMKGWANAGVDYIAIFKYNAESIPTPKYVFNIAKLFTMLFGAGVVVLLIINPFHYVVPMKIVPLLMWLSLLLFWVNPLNIFKRKARVGSIRSTLRILIAPLIFVYFTDFWFADQLNSIVAILLDFQYMVCYAIKGNWTGQDNTNVCTTSDNGIRPIISCLPALWRLLQCLRCFYNERKVSHLVNAGKYFTTFPVVIFATLFAVKQGTNNFDIFHLDFPKFGWIIILWFLFAFIHALYTFLWDVVCDWGLFNLRKRTLLRPRLLYRRRCFYYLAIIFDFFLRFAWAGKLTLAIVWHLDSDLIYTALVFGEMLRRYVWNYFRVEYEHVVKELD